MRPLKHVVLFKEITTTNLDSVLKLALKEDEHGGN